MTDNEAILDATKTGALVQFDLANMKDQVADQMRAFLLNMMPKEAFNGVIETAWKKLTEPRKNIKDSYGRVTQKEAPSELEEMTTMAMREELKKRVAKWQLEWAKTADCDLGAKTMFNELVNKAAGQFIQRVGVQIVNEAAQVLSSGASLDTVQCSSCHRTALKGQSCQCGAWN